MLFVCFVYKNIFLCESGYPQHPYLLTPIFNAVRGSKEELYTQKHLQALQKFPILSLSIIDFLLAISTQLSHCVRSFNNVNRIKISL